MILASSAFGPGEPIPARHTCEGTDVSPALEWTDVPSGTRSFALVVDDPDAPAGLWTHWTVWNLAPDVRALAEAVHIPPGEGAGVEGKNSWGEIGWRGPCPPWGVHRYRFRLRALDGMLDLPQGAAPEALEAAVNGHVLTTALLEGTYQREAPDRP